MSKCNLQKFPKLCSQLPGSCFYSLAPECVLSTRESSYNMSLIVWEHNKPKDPSRLYTYVCLYWACMLSKELHTQKDLRFNAGGNPCPSTWACGCLRMHTCVCSCAHAYVCVSCQTCNREGGSDELSDTHCAVSTTSSSQSLTHSIPHHQQSPNV